MDMTSIFNGLSALVSEYWVEVGLFILAASLTLGGFVSLF